MQRGRILGRSLIVWGGITLAALISCGDGKGSTSATAGGGGEPQAGAAGAGGAGEPAGGRNTQAGDAGGGSGARPCADYGDAQSCDDAGCVATVGTLFTLVDSTLGGAPSAGGAGGDGGTAPRCTTQEDFFISCEEGYGGAIQNYACNADCSSCLTGPWTVGRHAPYERQDCFWGCVDGEVGASGAFSR